MVLRLAAGLPDPLFGLAPHARSLPRSSHDHERMTAEAEVFIAALEHDIIDAEDFGSG